jgi:sec-independent protein translocase protein TatC
MVEQPAIVRSRAVQAEARAAAQGRREGADAACAPKRVRKPGSAATPSGRAAIVSEIDDTQAPLLDHLIELRRRLLWSLAALAMAFAGCLYFARQILRFLVAPLKVAGQVTIINTEVFGGFFVEIKVAFFAALMIAFPVIANQLWQFIAPGLYRKEKRALLPFLLATPVLFIAGASLAYFVAIPVALKFLLGFQGDLGGVAQQALPDREQLPEVHDAVHLRLRTVVPAAGAADAARACGHRHLRAVEGRMALRHRRARSRLSAVLTPPDIGSQLLLAVPLVGLYFLSLVAIWFTRRRRERAGGDRNRARLRPDTAPPL